MCKEERYTEIENEIAQLPVCKPWLTVQHKMQYVPNDTDSSSSDDDNETEDDDMDTEEAIPTVTKTHKNKAAPTSSTGSMETEDGWTTVTSRKRQ